MFRRRLTVSVPKPCHENWQDMTPQGQGQYCQSCAKMVVDFTGMTDAEVVAMLGKNLHKSCGYFREDQLNRELHQPYATKSRWAFQTLVLGFSAWIGLKSAGAQAQVKSAGTGIELLPSSSPSVFSTPPPPDSTTITGTVVAPAGELPNVTIRLNDTLEVKPDIYGNFSLPFSKDAPLELQWLTLSAPDLVTQRHRLADLNLTQRLQLDMLAEPQVYELVGRMAGGLVVHYKWYSPRGMYYKIRNLFW